MKNTDIKKSPVHILVDYYLEVRDMDNMPKKFYVKNNISYSRLCRTAKKVLELCDYDIIKAKSVLDKTAKWCEDRGLEWSFETCIKKFIELETAKNPF
jgi:hypothetical protein